MAQIEKSWCLLNREFPEFFKTHPTFIFRSSLRACRSLKPNRPLYFAALVGTLGVLPQTNIGTLGVLPQTNIGTQGVIPQKNLRTLGVIYSARSCPKIQKVHSQYLSGSTPRNQNKYPGSTPRVSIFVLWESYIRFIYSVNTTPSICILTDLGVLPQVLYHFCGSAPRKMVQYLWEYSQNC